MSARKIVPRTLLVISLVLTLSTSITPAHASAFKPFKEASAPWTNLYKTSSAALHVKKSTTSELPPNKHANTKSVFKVSYTDVPVPEQAAVQAAIDTWSDNWVSTVPVNVIARYTALGTSGILASASPVNYFNNFSGAPDNSLWYSSALANALAGKDLDPTSPEISININSSMVNDFYLGTDGNCPSQEYDLESIILHEIAHGLGFTSSDNFDVFSQVGAMDQPTPYDAYAETAQGERLMDFPSPSADLGQALQSPLFWTGKNAVAAYGGKNIPLFSPPVYQGGSSISHLDESTFDGTPFGLMVPQWSPGTVFHTPDAILLGMFADMRLKPPLGIPTGIPDAPQNVFAVVGDKSAIVTFSPPDNAKGAQVASYTVTVVETGATFQSPTSPVNIPGLVNGSHYTFSVTATNTLGTSIPSVSNTIYPQAAWSGTDLDATADAKYLTTTTFKGLQTILYTDGKNGDLKMAQWTGKTWTKAVIDGNSTKAGRTTDNVAGNLSVCTSPAGKNQRLDVVYADVTKKQLRYATYDGKSWKYFVVDGNGPSVLKYDNPIRTRTAGDVSGANACVDTPDGLQIFYRDNSQGIILGAVQNGAKLGNWQYEIVDGDMATNGRTTGDVGFHMDATNVGKNVYLIYDSVTGFGAGAENDPNRIVLKGEVRLATRSSFYPEDWQYQSLDSPGADVVVAGYDVSITAVGNKVIGSWLGATATSMPNPNQIRSQDITDAGPITSINTDIYGTPHAPLVTDGVNTAFNCQDRLCSINDSLQTVSLVTTSDFSKSLGANWVTINKTKYIVTGTQGKLQLFKVI